MPWKCKHVLNLDLTCPHEYGYVVSKACKSYENMVKYIWLRVTLRVNGITTSCYLWGEDKTGQSEVIPMWLHSCGLTRNIWQKNTWLQ